MRRLHQTSDIILLEHIHPYLLMPADANANVRQRVQPYIDWCLDTEQPPHDWLVPNLQVYGEHLQKRMKNRSVNAHLGTIRVQYRRLMREQAFREILLQYFSQEEFDGWLSQLRTALSPDSVDFPVEDLQANDNRLHLTPEQVKELLSLQDPTDLSGLRDHAIIRLMLATGIHESECVRLSVADLYTDLEGKPVLTVSKGKGRRPRQVPIGKMWDFFMPQVELWMTEAGIRSGPVFRAVHRSGQVRGTPLNKRSIEYILARYPITHENQSHVVKPQDLRATYARRASLLGVPVEAIMQNMGHVSIKTTLGYIGEMNASMRDFDIRYE